jgi:hypothetical protein
MFDENWHRISCKLSHFYNTGEQNTLQYITDITIKIQISTFTKNYQDIIGTPFQNFSTACNLNVNNTGAKQGSISMFKIFSTDICWINI